MDEQWLAEWVAAEAEYPPKTLREDVGALLAEIERLRTVVDAVRTLMAAEKRQDPRATEWADVYRTLRVLDELPPAEALTARAPQPADQETR